MSDRQKLFAAARAAAVHAHAPYSNFAVGAALLLDNGEIITGANFENASYGLSLCAETVALAKANSEGALRRVVELGVVGGTFDVQGRLLGTQPVRPCGRCRQILNEAAQLGERDIAIHCVSGDGSVEETHRLSDLLPYAFGPGDIAKSID